ncbi:MAG: tRNA pseudouridine(55) synthase TruB, partial [Pseudomonadota bacterium]
KTYGFAIRLGQATETDDAEGAVIAESAARPTDAEIEVALAAYRGDILQIPPVYSAVKSDGARAYDLARAGEIPELAPRPLHVSRLELLARPDADHAEFEMVCGKGGYVRSIGRDIGRDLGCHAHVSMLRRMASGGFDVANALPMAELDAVRAGEREAPLLPVEAGLASVPEIAVTETMAEDLRHGRSIRTVTQENGTVWASHNGTAVAICDARAGLLSPSRVLLHGHPAL